MLQRRQLKINFHKNISTLLVLLGEIVSKNYRRVLETTRNFPLNNVSQWDENNEHLKAARAGDFTGLIFTCLKLQNTRVFKSQREGCQSNQKLLHHYQHYKIIASKISSIHKFIPKPLSADITKWSNTLKQFVGKLPKNCLSVFPHFVGLALKGLKYSRFNGLMN